MGQVQGPRSAAVSLVCCPKWAEAFLLGTISPVSGHFLSALVDDQVLPPASAYNCVSLCTETLRRESLNIRTVPGEQRWQVDPGLTALTSRAGKQAPCCGPESLFLATQPVRSVLSWKLLKCPVQHPWECHCWLEVGVWFGLVPWRWGSTDYIWSSLERHPHSPWHWLALLLYFLLWVNGLEYQHIVPAPLQMGPHG